MILSFLQQFVFYIKWHGSLRYQIRVVFDNFGYAQILKMAKVRLYNQARPLNEGEGVSKSIISAFNFLLASKMFCLSSIYG